MKRRLFDTIEESYDMSDPDDIILNDRMSCSEEDNNCKKCGKNDGQDLDGVWMGCNLCKNWYHKLCMGERFCIMSTEDLEEYCFICPSRTS